MKYYFKDLYYITHYIDSESEKILDAMRHWENKTCIRFHSVTNMQSGVLFMKGSG